MTTGSLMKVESIAECSLWSILQYFWPALSVNQSWKPFFGIFESGDFAQVLLYYSTAIQILTLTMLNPDISCFVCLFCWFTSQSTAMVMGGHHTSSWASFRFYLTTTPLEEISRREENDCRNYFMINLHESMGLCQDQTRDPWICGQTRICSRTHYRLSYSALYIFCFASIVDPDRLTVRFISKIFCLHLFRLLM